MVPLSNIILIILQHAIELVNSPVQVLKITRQIGEIRCKSVSISSVNESMNLYFLNNVVVIRTKYDNKYTLKGEHWRRIKNCIQMKHKNSLTLLE